MRVRAEMGADGAEMGPRWEARWAADETRGVEMGVETGLKWRLRWARWGQNDGKMRPSTEAKWVLRWGVEMAEHGEHGECGEIVRIKKEGEIGEEGLSGERAGAVGEAPDMFPTRKRVRELGSGRTAPTCRCLARWHRHSQRPYDHSRSGTRHRHRHGRPRHCPFRSPQSKAGALYDHTAPSLGDERRRIGDFGRACASSRVPLSWGLRTIPRSCGATKTAPLNNVSLALSHGHAFLEPRSQGSFSKQERGNKEPRVDFAHAAKPSARMEAFCITVIRPRTALTFTTAAWIAA